MNLTTSIIVCTTIAGIFALITAILQVVKQINDAKDNAIAAQKSENKQKEISKLQEKLLNRSDNLIKGQQSVIDLQNALNEKNKRIEELQNETLSTVTGGENIPHLHFFFAGTGLFGNVVNVDKNLPLRNISIEIQELRNDFLVPNPDGTKSTNNPEAYKSYFFKIGDLSKNSKANFISQYYYPTRYKDVDFMFTIRWMNGFYTGIFTVRTSEKAEVTQNIIVRYTEGLKLKNVVRVNTHLATIKVATFNNN